MIFNIILKTFIQRVVLYIVHIIIYYIYNIYIIIMYYILSTHNSLIEDRATHKLLINVLHQNFIGIMGSSVLE